MTKQELLARVAASGWDAIPKEIHVRHLTEWQSILAVLDGRDVDEFGTGVQAMLAAGFSAGEIARAVQYDTGTILKWSQRAMAPAREESRLIVVAGLRALLAERLESWVNSGNAPEGLKTNRRKSAISLIGRRGAIPEAVG